MHFPKLPQGENAVIVVDVEMYEKTKYMNQATVIEARLYKRLIQRDQDL